ncbi:hypothetical protein PEC301653_41250 [Pectobacterium carotovorum subsp. carotovorum]|nr:hypothetical protein PEC301653_41250 [Pectobacterium carotovorum subsp. carotovorum]
MTFHPKNVRLVKYQSWGHLELQVTMINIKRKGPV